MRGRCFDCKRPIPMAYPAMEAAFGALAGLWMWRFGTGAESLLWLLFALILLLAAWVDWETQYIYDALSLPLLAAGLALGPLLRVHATWWSAPAGAGAMLALLWALQWLGGRIFRRHALGGGDVKLMAAGGAWLGLQAWKALILGALLGLPLMLLHQRLHGRSWRHPAPFGPGLCLGLLLVAWNALSGGDLDPLLRRLFLDPLMYSEE